jgi:hypothetical protein
MRADRGFARRAERRKDPWSRLAWGVILVAAGSIFWLDHLDRIDAREYLGWWPLALVVIGLAHLPQRRWFAAAAWVGIGVLFLPQLGIAFDGVRTVIALWPLLIAIGGVSLIEQALRPRAPGVVFSATAVMAGNTLLLGSQELSGADVIAVMGGCDIDLSGTPVPARDVTINVLAFWGGIDIRVPAGWKVIDQVNPILGGFEDSTVPPHENAPRLIVRGSAIMGGVEVKTSAGNAA